MEKKSKENKKNSVIPKHVGIIMDGNRRWAKERNLPTYEGHLKGYNKMRDVPMWFFKQGVEIVSLFAFSTENWSRSQEEVNYLMKLLKRALSEELDKFNERGYKLLISGRLDELPGDLTEVCNNAIDKTKDNNLGIVNICLNYGGRAEIVDVIKKIVKNKIDVEQIHEGLIKKYLYQNDIADPDIIVRTSGERRLSGFQMWEGVYSELLFMEKYWPDFESIDAENVLDEYRSRKRRFGKD